MITIASHLYRVDDKFMSSDMKSGDAAIIYDIESTQPRLGWSEVIDPDETRILIRS